MRPQKLKNNPTYPSASGCADPKIAPDLPKHQIDHFSGVWKFNTTFSTEKCCQNWKKKVVQFFIPDLGESWVNSWKR